MFMEASVVFSVQGLYFASTLYAIVPYIILACMEIRMVVT